MKAESGRKKCPKPWLDVAVDNLEDMTVDMLLADVPFASTLPRASVDLGKVAWGPAISDWLDKAGRPSIGTDCQVSPPLTSIRSTSNQEAQQEAVTFLSFLNRLKRGKHHKRSVKNTENIFPTN